jgi:type II secretory pathway pseudopilin PulG
MKTHSAKVLGCSSAHRVERAFTLIEIAIAIGVIGFALVAIIGILPMGLEVQRDNRTDTILNQDGTFWMEAIQNGARGIPDLVRYVDRIEISNTLSGQVSFPAFNSSEQVIGLLTRQAVVTNEEVRAIVWAMSGPAAEKDPSPANRELSFKYRMAIHIEPGTNFAASFTTLATNPIPPLIPYWPVINPDPLATLYHLRLTLAYPLSGKAPQTDPEYSVAMHRLTARRQSFRALVSREIETNIIAGEMNYFFTP